MATLAKRFMDLFAGLTRAYGQYRLPEGVKANAKGKVEIPSDQRRTVHQPVTEELWQAHLDGRDAIGIVPINDTHQTKFGAIDIDTYPIDLLMLRRKLTAIKAIGCWVLRTKSGGAHIYLFTIDFVPAALMRRRLQEIAIALGYPKAEIFSKQDKLEEGGTGNWINMPYQSGNNSNRYAINENGEMIPVEEFIELAEKGRLTALALENYELAQPAIDESWLEAPPCLLTLVEIGFPEGSRNESFYNIMVYLKKRFPDDWWDRAPAYVEKFMNNPLPRSEVLNSIRNFRRSQKSYQYSCKKEPICDHCDKPTCKTRHFGVGPRDAEGNPISHSMPDGLHLGQLKHILTVPDTWRWDINEKEVNFDSTEDLMSGRRFSKRLIEKLHLRFAISDTALFKEFKAHLENGLLTVIPPDSALPNSQLLLGLQDYIDAGAGTDEDQMVQGKVWVDGNNAYFLPMAAIKYLNKILPDKTTTQKLWGALEEQFKDEAQEEERPIKGRRRKVWKIPRLSPIKEKLTVRRLPPEEAL